VIARLKATNAKNLYYAKHSLSGSLSFEENRGEVFFSFFNRKGRKDLRKVHKDFFVINITLKMNFFYHIRQISSFKYPLTHSLSGSLSFGKGWGLYFLPQI